MVETEFRDNIALVRMTTEENRLRADFLGAVEDALDEAEQNSAVEVLVTMGIGKIYSNGLDLEWLLGEGASQADEFLARLDNLFARFMTFPTPTLAMLNGHAFAGGAMIALSHDYRVMRSDRGYLCLPEVDLGIPFRPGMISMIKEKLPTAMFTEAVVLGKRYTAVECLDYGVVTAIAPEAELLDITLEAATRLAKSNRKAVRTIKRSMYPETIKLLQGS